MGGTHVPMARPTFPSPGRSHVSPPVCMAPPKAPAKVTTVRVDVLESQASAAREAYLADRLAQIDSWAYDQRPWGPMEMPVPSSLPFGRDPRGRVQRRVEKVMRQVGESIHQMAPKGQHDSSSAIPHPNAKSAQVAGTNGELPLPATAKEPAQATADLGSTSPMLKSTSPTVAVPTTLSSEKKRWSMRSLKTAAAAEQDTTPPQLPSGEATSTMSPKPTAPATKASCSRPLSANAPSAFKRWSVMRLNEIADGTAPPPTSVPPLPPGAEPAARPTPPALSLATLAAPLKKNRRWSIQNLREVLAGDSASTRSSSKTADAGAPEETIITHLPERTSSIAGSPVQEKTAPAAKKRPINSNSEHHATTTLPSPTLSLVSLDIDFDLFGLASSDSQSVKTPPERRPLSSRLSVHSNEEPGLPPQVGLTDTSNSTSEYASSPDPQMHVERDAWRHEALLLYDQLCYWRLESLERGRERDGWRRVALAAGVQVPPSIVKQLPPALPAPVSPAQQRAKEIEREREKGRERVREWHLAAIERERREHERRETEKRVADRDLAERRELERRVLEKRAMERREMERRGLERRELEHRQREWRDYERRDHERREKDRRSRHLSRRPSRESWVQPNPNVQSPLALVSQGHIETWYGHGHTPVGPIPSAHWGAAVDAAGIVGVAGAPGGSWGRQQRLPAPVHVDLVMEHDARLMAAGWPASESGRERARELLGPNGAGLVEAWGGPWPRRSGTA